MQIIDHTLGSGPYKAYEGKVKTPAYVAWRDMIRRCAEHVAYADCSVCPEWLNFQNFAEWHEANAPTGKGFQLDKDIKIRGNKIYSPETCAFVPHEINNLVVVKKPRGLDLPPGVSPNGTGFLAQIRIRSKLVYLGTYRTPDEASQVYNRSKEEYVKKMALEYKGSIDDMVFESLMKWTVNG